MTGSTASLRDRSNSAAELLGAGSRSGTADTVSGSSGQITRMTMPFPELAIPWSARDPFAAVWGVAVQKQTAPTPADPLPGLLTRRTVADAA